MDVFNFDDLYNEQFELTYAFAKRGLTGNDQEDIRILRTTIQTLLDYQGLDWTGRGELFLTKNQASIAATELLLAQIQEKTEKKL